MSEPLPHNYDYQGNERLPAYVRSVTNVPCTGLKSVST